MPRARTQADRRTPQCDNRGGQAFTVTRDGHQIGELIPLRQRRRFVPRQEFAAMSRSAAATSIEAFRADQDAAADHDQASPYDQ